MESIRKRGSVSGPRAEAEKGPKETYIELKILRTISRIKKKEWQRSTWDQKKVFKPAVLRCGGGIRGVGGVDGVLRCYQGCWCWWCRWCPHCRHCCGGGGGGGGAPVATVATVAVVVVVVVVMPPLPLAAAVATIVGVVMIPGKYISKL